MIDKSKLPDAGKVVPLIALANPKESDNNANNSSLVVYNPNKPADKLTEMLKLIDNDGFFAQVSWAVTTHCDLGDQVRNATVRRCCTQVHHEWQLGSQPAAG